MEEFFTIKRIASRKNILIFAAMGVLLLGTIFISNSLNKEITIIDQNKMITIRTISSNVERVLAKANVYLSEYDRLSVEEGTKLEDGMTIVVYRAVPIKIEVDGQVMEVMSSFSKVKDVLEQYDVTLGERDRVEPGLEEIVKAEDTINVVRVREEIVKNIEEIPYKSVIKYNDDMEYKTQRKVQEGKAGKREIEYKVIYENGKEVERQLVKENIIEEPIDEIIEKGSEKYLVASRGQVVRYKKAMIMTATAYDLSYESCGKEPDHPLYGITYTGTRARPGVVAVDPNVIPLGSKLYVESLDSTPDYGFAYAEDTGSAIKGNKIDLFMENRSDALRYGKRKVKVYILE